ncbi:hypothetical protein T492DRAFT_531816 [Pavlovales sp. CCMP2436]|nr:hypothetical protein T492DRAFT_531816 [Pavlovales sp. CCMP2436]
MGKLRDTKRDVRYGRAGPAADLRKAEKKAAGKLKHTKHALFSADGGVAVGKEGAGAIAKKDKGPAKRAAVSGKGVKRSEGGEAVGKAAAETTGRKAAGLARLANAKGKPPPSAPRERKAIVARVYAPAADALHPIQTLYPPFFSPSPPPTCTSLRVLVWNLRFWGSQPFWGSRKPVPPYKGAVSLSPSGWRASA